VTAGVAEHVRQLQEDLRELGFLVVPEPTPGSVAKFDMYTDWAVREFQIYASMPHVARMSLTMAADGVTETHNRLRDICNSVPTTATTPPTNPAEYQYPNDERPAVIAALGHIPAGADLHGATTGHPVSYYVASLEQVVNGGMYNGPISGVVNQETRNAIAYWKEHRYRCPVVIEAWNVVANTGARTRIASKVGGGMAVNIWRTTEITNDPRIFFRDFTEYYPYPGARNRTHYQVLGTRATYTTHSGPLSKVPSHTWTQAEITPDLFIGPSSNLATLQTAANINGAEASTYRVIRAVAEQECMGHFDSVNSYDGCIVSIGPCHWTMGLFPAGGTNYNNGELAGFLSYLLHQYPDDYRRAYGDFGLYPATAWTSRSNPTGRGTMWNEGLKKYEGWYVTHREGVTRAQMASSLATLPTVNRNYAEANYYSTLHWFFRWVMAGRTIQGVQRAMWDMTRMRIQDILDVSLLIDPTGHPSFTDTIENMVTSEKGIAFLLRWHIFRPGDVTQNSGHVRTAIRETIASSGLANWNNRANWQNTHEAAITQGLLAHIVTWRQNIMNSPTLSIQQKNNHFTKSLLETTQRVDQWPTYTGRNNLGYHVNSQLGALRVERNSLSFSSTGL
jgi:hypothetical protein